MWVALTTCHDLNVLLSFAVVHNYDVNLKKRKWSCTPHAKVNNIESICWLALWPTAIHLAHLKIGCLLLATRTSVKSPCKRTKTIKYSARQTRKRVLGASELFSFLELVRFNWRHVNHVCWEMFKRPSVMFSSMCSAQRGKIRIVHYRQWQRFFFFSWTLKPQPNEVVAFFHVKYLLILKPQLFTDFVLVCSKSLEQLK